MGKLFFFVAEILVQFSFFMVHFPVLLEGQMAVGGLKFIRLYFVMCPMHILRAKYKN